MSVEPHTETVWSTVYALAREKLFRGDVDLDGKTDAEAVAEIRLQLAEQGWTPAEVTVERNGDTVVSLSADDDDGRRLRVIRRTSGREADHVQIEPEPIDQAREPGMTDAELRDKILAQLHARGLDAEVTVVSERVLIFATRTPE